MATIFDNPDVATIILKLKKSKYVTNHITYPRNTATINIFLTEFFYFGDLLIVIIKTFCTTM